VRGERWAGGACWAARSKGERKSPAGPRGGRKGRWARPTGLDRAVGEKERVKAGWARLQVRKIEGKRKREMGRAQLENEREKEIHLNLNLKFKFK
jgi:hypothetical protein